MLNVSNTSSHSVHSSEGSYCFNVSNLSGEHTIIKSRLEGQKEELLDEINSLSSGIISYLENTQLQKEHKKDFQHTINVLNRVSTLMQRNGYSTIFRRIVTKFHQSSSILAGEIKITPKYSKRLKDHLEAYDNHINNGILRNFDERFPDNSVPIRIFKESPYLYDDNFSLSNSSDSDIESIEDNKNLLTINDDLNKIKLERNQSIRKDSFYEEQGLIDLIRNLDITD